jgi:hypothetical protein
MEPIELTERERLIAKEAARIAIEELSDEFYKKVGKAVIEKALIILGAVVVAFLVGKNVPIKF